MLCQGAAPVAAEEAEPPSQALAECTAPSVPVAQASIEPLDEGALAANPPAEAPAAPAAHAETGAQADAAPAALIDARVLAPAPALTPAEPEAAGIEPASAPMAEASLFAEFADNPGPVGPDTPSSAAVALPADWGQFARRSRRLSALPAVRNPHADGVCPWQPAGALAVCRRSAG